MRALGKLLSHFLGFLWFAFVVALPLLGVWLASSLVALAGGPRWLALTGGVLLFPVLPVWWEARAGAAWKKKQERLTRLTPPKPRRLTWVDRVVLRTLSLNLLFIAALLFTFPKVAFTALATRGDWFLGDADTPAARDTRKVLASVASGLEWLHEWANPNPYKTAADTPIADAVAPTSSEAPTGDAWKRWRTPEDAGSGPRADLAPSPLEAGADAGTTVTSLEADAGETGDFVFVVHPEGDVQQQQQQQQQQPPPPPAEELWRVGSTTWPQADTVHPAVAGMTASDERSIEAVARYLRSHTDDPFDRVKALHDWVVTRLTYDEASVRGPRKPQDAETVFQSRTGVCEGYARLMVELGRFSGDRIVYVTGEVREPNGQLAPVGHAWNAVEIHGAWYLLDATWDDPVVNGKSDRYQSDYLFIPPKLAAMDHFPDDERFQLLPAPLSRVDFLRQPPGRPGLARQGLVLVEPQAGAVDVRDVLAVTLENPRHINVMLAVSPEAGGAQLQCGVSDEAKVRLECQLPAAGRYTARLFTNKERYGTYGSVADFQVISR
ncbi:MAG: transglutaminase domain-containing protein [Myxococcota bacterium]